ncbi:MAG: AAA family ATPase [Candidatus Acidiferrum sp.]
MASTTGTLDQLFAFFGLREDPFHISPNPRFYYSTPTHDSALAELVTGIQTRQGLLVLTGDAGSGKTTLIHRLLKWLETNQRSSAYVFHTLLEPSELLEFILHDFGIMCSSSRKGDLVATLHRWLFERSAAGDSPVLIVDEAQALSLGTMDELRLLLNLENDDGKLLQIVLAGQLELEEKLRHPELHQLRQRIMIHSRLSPLKMEETSRYISARLCAAGAPPEGLFPWDTVTAIHCYSRGIPRIVNLLCKEALISAYASQKHTIGPECIYRIVSELDLRLNPIVSSAPVLPVTSTLDPPIIAPGADRNPTHWAVNPHPAISTGVRAKIGRSREPGNASARLQSSALSSSVAGKPAGHGQTSRTLRALIVGSWIEFWDSVFRYVPKISNSFIQDCKLFLQRLTAPQTLSVPTVLPGSNLPVHKRVVVRLGRWLRQPLTPPSPAKVNRPPVRQTSTKQM